MAATASLPSERDTQTAFGFIAIDEHTHKGCVIQEATDLGAYLVMIDTTVVPDRFVLYSLFFDRAQPCKVVWRTDEVIGAWFDGDEV